MAGTTKIKSMELRAAIQAAVDAGNISPTEVLEYLEDNGYDPIPHRATVISILPSCGVVQIRQAWIMKSELEAEDEE